MMILDPKRRRLARFANDDKSNRCTYRMPYALWWYVALCFIGNTPGSVYQRKQEVIRPCS